MYTTDNQWEHTAQHRELYSTPCANLNGKEMQTRGDTCIHMGFPGGTSGKEPPANAGYMRHRFNPWVGKMPQEEGMQPTPVFFVSQGVWHDWIDLACTHTHMDSWVTWLYSRNEHNIVKHLYCQQKLILKSQQSHSSLWDFHWKGIWGRFLGVLVCPV